MLGEADASVAALSRAGEATALLGRMRDATALMQRAARRGRAISALLGAACDRRIAILTCEFAFCFAWSGGYARVLVARSMD